MTGSVNSAVLRIARVQSYVINLHIAYLETLGLWSIDSFLIIVIDLHIYTEGVSIHIYSIVIGTLKFSLGCDWAPIA